MINTILRGILLYTGIGVFTVVMNGCSSDLNDFFKKEVSISNEVMQNANSKCESNGGLMFISDEQSYKLTDSSVNRFEPKYSGFVYQRYSAVCNSGVIIQAEFHWYNQWLREQEGVPPDHEFKRFNISITNNP